MSDEKSEDYLQGADDYAHYIAHYGECEKCREWWTFTRMTFTRDGEGSINMYCPDCKREAGGR